MLAYSEKHVNILCMQNKRSIIDVQACGTYNNQYALIVNTRCNICTTHIQYGNQHNEHKKFGRPVLGN
jgi:hypothetical protein